MAKRDYHVVPHPDGWAVRREGTERASSVHPTQQGPIEAGRDAAKAQRSELVIRGPDGRIRDNFGNDPHPPRDTKP